MLVNEVMGALLGRAGRWFRNSIRTIKLVCQVRLVVALGGCRRRLAHPRDCGRRRRTGLGCGRDGDPGPHRPSKPADRQADHPDACGQHTTVAEM
jgi:hypothetical protein